MNRLQKKYFVIIGLIILSIGAVSIFLGVRIHEQRQEEDRLEAIRIAEEQEIIDTYHRLHYAFGFLIEEQMRPNDELGEVHGRYRPLRVEAYLLFDFEYAPDLEIEIDLERFPHGIDIGIYIALRLYYNSTGNYLSYGLVEDYFSTKFEPDGSLRLYNNGNHPEIEGFVTWMWEGRRREEYLSYWESLERIYSEYFFEHREQGFTSQNFSHLSPQMIDALVRAEADPRYVLDLTSLQEQGY